MGGLGHLVRKEDGFLVCVVMILLAECNRRVFGN